MSQRALVLGFVLGALASVFPACGGSPCNAKNCSTGCCDSMGRCQPGTAPSSCGKGGESCAMCAPGQSCTMQICGGLSGSGGGTAGGAGGGFSSAGGSSIAGGSVDAGGCREYGEIDFGADPVFGGFTVGEPDSGLDGFEWWNAEVDLEAPMARTDIFISELYFETADGPPTFPHTGDLPANTSFSSCYECFWASLGCDDMGENCAGDYLATSGHYEYTAAQRDRAIGEYVGTGTNLTFRKWNLTSDRPNGTECFTVSKFHFRGMWPDRLPDGGLPPMNDAGLPDAGLSDAGASDAGTTTGDAGAGDAGVADAGRDGG